MGNAASGLSGNWASKNPMPTARTGLGLALSNGKLYAIGGKNQTSNLGTVEEYEPKVR